MPEKILIVDTDPVLLQLLSQKLGRAGYQTVTAATGPAALEAAQTDSKPDLMILGVNLPEMNGFEVAKSLQSQPNTANIPIIALSSMTSAESIERGRQVGFQDYVAKFDRPGLIAALKEQSSVMAA